MTLVEKEHLCKQELGEFLHLIDLDLSSYPADVEAALHFIHAHLFEESLTASRIQRQDGLRSHNLASRFKRYFGLGLRDYIEDRRIMAAMRLLWHEDLEIYLVASAVGYAHHETFTRAFKRRIGRPPSAFRVHFIRPLVAHARPSDSLPAADEPAPIDLPLPRASPSTLQPLEAPMFITDIIGIRTSDETHDLRVSGTAAGVAEVYVNAAASGEARTQVAEVGPDGRWVALFGSEEGVFACSRPLLIEVGTEDQTQVRWEGLLDCAEVVPRRARVQSEAVAGDAGEGTALHSSAGGAYGENAAMTVTVATGRGPAPPPLRGTREGDDGAPYYGRGRSANPPAAQTSSAVQAPEETSSTPDTGRPNPPAEASSQEARDLREEIAALRSQIGQFSQGLGTDPARGSDPDASPPSEGGTEMFDGLREEIAALRQGLLEQQTERRPAEKSHPEASDRQSPTTEEARSGAENQAMEKQTSEKRTAEDETAPAWRREIHDLRERIESLLTTESKEDQTEPEGHSASDEQGDGDGGSETDGPDWQRAVADLQDQVEALRNSEDSSRSPDAAASDTSRNGASEADEDDACDDDVSLQSNRADLYDAVVALRERIVQLERSDDNSGRPGDQYEQQPRSGRRETPVRASDEIPPEDRGPGVPARQHPDDQQASLRRPRGHNTQPGRRDSYVDRRGLRREDTPVIKFEPFDVREGTEEGCREVRVRARVTHPSGRPVAAELADDRDDQVLADGRSERGSLTLEEWVEMEPGTATFTVTVTEPSLARLSIAWTLDEREGRKQSAPREGDPEEEDAGWVSRAVGGAWSLMVALFLLSLAAGVHGFLRGAIAAIFLGFLGSYLALTVPHRWGVWTSAGIGLFTLAVVALLPFTPIIQMDSYLLVAGLAMLGLVAAAVVALFVSKDEAKDES